MPVNVSVTSGLLGGNIDDFIAYIGNIRAFRFSDRSHGVATFVEGNGTTGETVEILLRSSHPGNVSAHELRLLDQNGKMLVDITLNNIGYIVTGSTVFDTLIDSMMNMVQTNPTAELTFVGKAGDDSFTGRINADDLNGGAGDDTLDGGGGNDSLVGGKGDDELAGGKGHDLLTGNLGADLFVFSGKASDANGDRISDFSAPKGDRIDLSQFDAIPDMTLPGLDDFVYIGTGVFSGVKGELRHHRSGLETIIQGDLDGDAIADFTIFLDGHKALSAGSFLF